MLSDTDHDLLMNAAFQIMDSSLDSGALFEETCSLSKKIKLETKDTEPCDATVESFLSVLQQNQFSVTEQTAAELLPTPALAKQVIDLSSANTKKGPLLTQPVLDKFDSCLSLLKSSISVGSFNSKLFLSMVTKHELHLEVVWSLNKCGAMTLENYLSSKLANAAFTNSLSVELVHLCQGPQETIRRRQDIMSGLISYLVKEGFGERKTIHKRGCIEILDNILQESTQLSSTPEEAESMVLPFDFVAFEEVIQKETLKKFSTHTLSYILSHKAGQSAQASLESQKDWKSIQVYGTLRTILKQLFLPLECHEVIGILKRYLEQNKIDSTLTLTFLSVLYLTWTDAAMIVLAYIKSQLSSGLDVSDVSQITGAFLLARLSVAVGDTSFPSYATWFESMFSESSTSLATTRPSFYCLVKFLSSLVPIESAEYLRTHILKKPFVPSKCKEIFEDYAVLAKTRLKDLQVPLHNTCDGIYEDGGGGFGRDGNNSKDGADPVEKEVEKAMDSFLETGKIPTALIEASIFRRPYFIGKFLPALLKPRFLPDVPDVKMKLIEEVKKSGKIPQALYNHYVEDCEKEKQMLLEVWLKLGDNFLSSRRRRREVMQSVFDVDDDDEEMLELELPAMEQLSKRLDKYFSCGSQVGDRERDYLNTVLEKINNVLGDSDPQTLGEWSDPSYCLIDLTNPIDKCLDAGVASVILEHISHKLEALHQSSIKEKTLLLKRLDNFITLVTKQFSSLRLSLLSVVMYNLKMQRPGRSLSMSAVAVTVLSLVSTTCSQLTQISVKLKDPSKLSALPMTKTYNGILEAVLHCFDCGTGHGLELELRFWLEYIILAALTLDAMAKDLENSDVIEVNPLSVTEDQLLPGFMITRVMLLCRRFGIEKDFHTQNQAAEAWDVRLVFARDIFESTRWKVLTKKHQLSLQTWIEFELCLSPLKDFLSLSERTEFMWDMSTYFLRTAPQMEKVINFCSELARNLARSQTKASSRNEDGQWSFQAFHQLLNKQLLQLPTCDSSHRPWLELTLKSQSSASTGQEMEAILRISLDLPPYLLFSNHPHEKISQANVDSALAVLGYFSVSDQNRGCFLTKDTTVHILQGYVMAKRCCQSVEDLQPVLSHPIICVSILKHRQILEDLAILQELEPGFKSQIVAVADWSHSVAEDGKVYDLRQPVPSLLKAVALFVSLHHSQCNKALPEKLLQTKDNSHFLLFVLELTAGFLTVDGAFEKWKKSPMAQAFVKILTFNGDLMTQLLDLTHPELSDLRHQLGLSSKPWLIHIRDLYILCLSVVIPGHLLAKRTAGNVIRSVVTAYIRVLRYANEGGMKEFKLQEENSKTDLSGWIKHLTDHSSYDNICEISDQCLSSLEDLDLMLFRYIQEKRKGWL